MNLMLEQLSCIVGSRMSIMDAPHDKIIQGAFNLSRPLEIFKSSLLFMNDPVLLL